MDEFLQDLVERIKTLECVFEDLVSIQVKAAEYGVPFSDVNMYKEIVNLSDLIMRLRYRQRELEIKWHAYRPPVEGQQIGLCENEGKGEYHEERTCH